MDAIRKIEAVEAIWAALPELPANAGYALVQGFGGTEDRLLSSTYDPNSAAYSATQMRTALAALASKEAEIARLQQELNVASVDFERQVSERCMAVMKALMETATPIEGEDMDCHIPGADYAQFVNDHADLLYVIANGKRRAALTQPTE